ncbi:MAG: response regulator transcription factor [Bacteroidetes bacterium]|jgi:two-component system alkaline phosphatase synthesis response regulator PhoP|nr:response regulator transcription factor [Bacteroidota bacterium]MBP6315087.1 response regulator transcription factor [Chitinophagaceae bacterium]
MEKKLGKVLVVDDEKDILQIVKYNLELHGYEVETAENGVDAITKLGIFKPDLVLLDIMMPHKDGIQTCIEIRANPDFDDTIIIFLTALSDEKSEIRGLELGADDYIAKPIKPKLLVSRIHSAFRRITKDDSSVIIFPDLEINREKFLVVHKGKEVSLPRKEFELFSLLASKPGRVFLRNEILDKVWGNEVIVGDRTIDVHVRKIRQKLNADFISTVKGVGYKFQN